MDKTNVNFERLEKYKFGIGRTYKQMELNITILRSIESAGLGCDNKQMTITRYNKKTYINFENK